MNNKPQNNKNPFQIRLSGCRSKREKKIYQRIIVIAGVAATGE